MLARLGKRGLGCGARQPVPGAAMYYKFSGFTQRLAGATAPAAYTPQVTTGNSNTLTVITRDLTFTVSLQLRSSLRVPARDISHPDDE